MRSSIGIALLIVVATVGCTHPTTSANAYDSSGTWAALNQSQAEGDFYNGMSRRLLKIGFVCTSKSEALTACVKRAALATCTYIESIEFNSAGVSRYSLDKSCAA